MLEFYGIFLIYFLIGVFISSYSYDHDDKAPFFRNFKINEKYSINHQKNIRKVVYFNNLKAILFPVVYYFSFSLFYIIVIPLNLFNFNKTAKIVLFPNTLFLKLFFLIGQYPAYKSRIRIKNNDEYQTIYTLNGQMKFYKNGKLHCNEKRFKIIEDDYISSAVRNLPFYQTKEGGQKFHFNYKEEFYLEGNKIERILHSEFLKLNLKNKLINF